jgi:uncharacterized damage-inducible protein DinB
MEAETLRPEIVPLYEMLRLNTRLFRNCLDGVDDTSAQRRSRGGNNMTFIALHLVDARCFLARYLGLEATHPYAEALSAVGSIDEMTEFPPLAGVITAWLEVSRLLAQRLPELSGAELRASSAQKFPVGDATLLGGITFLLQHESFHIGQMALLRRQLGLGPMSYADHE